ncbi:IclR family transcriptional regulator [Actinomadura sp. ATCC 31491]|uniref:IclR family transcriptional regulator n=1 Tax=Actinomadura luzonensis TaxID=2805427 RepID=A0ABT0G4E0_9ACTN|nr:IclR family transcriptional regulator [Actinomadura luzonensis]MCK2218998.1 IclR family transcriptional regulator [Actinomadura luzonensis]
MTTPGTTPGKREDSAPAKVHRGMRPAGELPGPGGRSVTSRVLSVLDAFSGERRRMSLSDISRRTAMPLTTAYRLVSELVAWGALERDRDGRYQIGLRLWEVAALAPRGPGLREAAMPFLEDLYEATHQHVQLAVLDGADVVVLERISGRGSVGVRGRVGGRLPAHATGVGLVLLAYAPPEAQERYLAGPLVALTERTVADPGRLRAVLAGVRRDGYAISDRQVQLDAVSVAAPVRDAAEGVVAALSVVVRAGDPQPGVLVPPVVAAARGVSRRLSSRA